MHLILLFFMAIRLDAREIQIKHRLLSYQIHEGENTISYSGKNVKLSIDKKKCNEHLLKEFHAQINRALAGDFLNAANSETYEILVDQSKRYDLLSSKRAYFFSQFDSYFKSLKIEEGLNCKK